MNPLPLFGLQFTLSLIIFGTAAKWYVAPALSKLPMQAALTPLFLVHALRGIDLIRLKVSETATARSVPMFLSQKAHLF